MRVASYVPLLAAHGITLDYRPALSDHDYNLLSSSDQVARKAAVLLRSAARAAQDRSDHDLRFVHRLRLLSPFPGLDPPRRIDAYDLDDALFVGSAAPANARYAWAKQEARRSVSCLQRARLVIAGNAFLADRAMSHNRRVEVVPSCVDPSRQVTREHGPMDVVTIGWIGSQTTSPYLEPVLPAIAALNEHALRAKLVVVGADTGVRTTWIEHRSWSLERERDELAGFDVGIMPLPDTDWARGKCGYKLLQYFSAGVAAVASPVGVAPELIGAERGLLASTPQQWRLALGRLIAAHDERRDRGAAARAFVEGQYSYQRWAPELARLLKALA